MAHVKQADNRPTHSAPEFRLNRSNGSSSYSMDVFFCLFFLQSVLSAHPKLVAWKSAVSGFPNF